MTSGENILIADDFTPRICDFEMSKDLSADVSSTMVGGTRGFMDPQVVLGRAKPSCASDMYAFGVLILNTLHDSSIEDYPIVDAAEAPELDPKVRSIVARLMSQRPSERPTAVELQADPFFGAESLVEWKKIEAGERASKKTCRQEMLDADPTALGLPNVARIVAEIDVHMARLQGLSETESNHRFAMFLYSLESDVYRKLNAALREREGPRFDAWWPYFWHLIQALQALPDVAATVYRGLNAPNLAEYQKSKRVHWSGFSSTSSNVRVASKPPFYYGEPGVVVSVDIYHALLAQASCVLLFESNAILMFCLGPIPCAVSAGCAKREEYPIVQRAATRGRATAVSQHGVRCNEGASCAESRRAERLQSHRNATDPERYAMVVRELLMLMSVFYSFDISALRWQTVSPTSSPQVGLQYFYAPR